LTEADPATMRQDPMGKMIGIRLDGKIQDLIDEVLEKVSVIYRKRWKNDNETMWHDQIADDVVDP
jgi:hypothetical protein